jgi:hypothetical protein
MRSSFVEMRRLLALALILFPACHPVDRPAPAAVEDPRSATAAADLVRLYFDRARAGDLDAAAQLWADPALGRAFAVQWRGVRAEVGAPGSLEGAAGSSYVEVPVRIDGLPGTATLRRVNDVPGSTEAQRRWHIQRIAVLPAG